VRTPHFSGRQLAAFSRNALQGLDNGGGHAIPPLGFGLRHRVENLNTSCCETSGPAARRRWELRFVWRIRIMLGFQAKPACAPKTAPSVPVKLRSDCRCKAALRVRWWTLPGSVRSGLGHRRTQRSGAGSGQDIVMVITPDAASVGRYARDEGGRGEIQRRSIDTADFASRYQLRVRWGVTLRSQPKFVPSTSPVPPVKVSVMVRFTTVACRFWPVIEAQFILSGERVGDRNGKITGIPSSPSALR